MTTEEFRTFLIDEINGILAMPGAKLFQTEKQRNILAMALAYVATADWLWSGVCTRFPRLQVALSEGGLGWVNMLADRADYVLDHSASGQEGGHWTDDRPPSEVLAENFWYCTIDDPSTIDSVLARFGPDHVLLEVDYPHADSTWPDTQAITHRHLGHLDADVIEKLTHTNAEELFRWPAR